MVLQFQQVVHLCGIDKFTNNLPAGLDTEIGEKGVRISGGQKQRIAIARALLYQPEILLLDEATSALDAATEQSVVATIAGLKGKMTILAITHRPALLDVIVTPEAESSDAKSGLAWVPDLQALEAWDNQERQWRNA